MTTAVSGVLHPATGSHPLAALVETCSALRGRACRAKSEGKIAYLLYNLLASSA
jgi:hypothetical protein